MRIVFCAILSLILMVGCVPHKKITYFKDINESQGGTLAFPNPPAYMLQPGDIVELQVSSTSQETAQYFSKPGSDVDRKYAGNTYQINDGGQIDMPLVGLLQVGGLTTDSAQTVIRSALLKYLQKPTVNLRMVSFRITVLGEVDNPGVYDVPDGQVNILEALGYAGDMTIYGQRENVLLIRNEGDEKIYHRLNLNDSSTLTSEYFYLKNNDVLYVEPSKGATSKDDNAYRILPLVLSSLTFIVVIIGVMQ